MQCGSWTLWEASLEGLQGTDATGAFSQGHACRLRLGPTDGFAGIGIRLRAMRRESPAADLLLRLRAPTRQRDSPARRRPTLLALSRCSTSTTIPTASMIQARNHWSRFGPSFGSSRAVATVYPNYPSRQEATRPRSPCSPSPQGGHASGVREDLPCLPPCLADRTSLLEPWPLLARCRHARHRSVNLHAVVTIQWSRSDGGRRANIDLCIRS